MKISDIKDPELKALAIKRMKEQNKYDTFGENTDIDEAFIWQCTDEGHAFWNNIYRQPIEISTLYQPLFNLMSKEYDLTTYSIRNVRNNNYLFKG
jgi:hypothetical protein